jgi:RimJ/RimL family protein N-acetyltransferase
VKGTDTLVGIPGLQGIDWEVPKFEIGYWCRTSFTGHGFITEAVKSITSITFEVLDARRVESRCDPDNLKSTRVAERAGFTLEATLHNNELGTLRDTMIFAMTPEHRRPTS